MCLVSYIPTKTGFILSSNRDETPLRADTELTLEKVKDKQVIHPLDEKGGSWIYLSGAGTCICVLNGAFNIHKRLLPYRLSRGLMMRSYFSFENTAAFLKDFDFQGIEPFTMIIKDHKGLYEFRWDAQYKHIQILDSLKSYVWSSCTLYTEDMQIERENKFYSMLKPDAELEDIQQVHLTGSVDDPENDFVMNRENRVATISHTNAVVDGRSRKMIFQNLINNNKEEMTFD